MKKTAACIVIMMAAACVVHAIDFKKNTITGAGAGGATFQSHSISFNSSGSGNTSNSTTVITRNTPRSSSFRSLGWGSPFGPQTLEQRIRDAEQQLFKLYFIRDVCRTLEDEITITFEKQDIREVIKQVSTIKGVKLPYSVPEGEFMVEKSDVSGMPTDQFLETIAQVSGLTLQYERDKLVFVKQEKQTR